MSNNNPHPTAEFCNDEYCLCNPHHNTDQQCPSEWESSTRIECPKNLTTPNPSSSLLTILCSRGDRQNTYFTNATCDLGSWRPSITKLDLVRNDDQSIEWSCNDDLGSHCWDIPLCVILPVISDSPTLAPSAEDTSAAISSINHPMVSLLWACCVLVLARKY
mmetsp:Transcript_11359/g.27374  ORF Transcript_11359/g.27374 Transcript_11359/m.27374 type:complete len:162 (-) Transcript_11359:158-643(-)